MKKGLLAVAALTGAALTTNAALLKINDQTFANFGLKMQIYGMVKSDAAKNGDDTAVDFSIHNTRIYFSGQLNPIVQFGANFDFTLTGQDTDHEGTKTTRVRDAFVNFHFMNEFNVMAGVYRVPFSREGLIDEYNRIFMPQAGETPEGDLHDNAHAPFTLTAALNTIDNDNDAYRDAGVTIWGDVLNGMVKYYVGVYDGFGDHNVNEALDSPDDDNLAYGIRVQFTPTMLGFQGEKGYLVKETYLGKKNVLSVGVGYYASKLSLGGEDYDTKSWTIDANWEQKFGVFIPKVMAAYTYHDPDDPDVIDNIQVYTVKAGVLYDQNLWLGKPGIYVKYQKVDFDLKGASDWEPSMWAIAVPYYLADQNAKIVLQYNYYDNDDEEIRGGNDNDKNYDLTLAFQVQF
jgi:hypothetical protein